ncbi:MAG: DUF4386 domain-containing protein [Acidobacteriia bacterium]|nr:DUF4386 domain-containing protein [Terriglobia bacterium]
MSTTLMMERTAETSPRIRSATSIGRIVGVLLLVHFAAGLIVPFVLLDRVRRPAGFLAGAAGSPVQVRAAVFLLFVGGAVAIGIAITAWPVFRRYSSAMALWLLALAVAAFALQAVDNGALLSILSLSQEYAKADAAKLDLFQVLAGVVGSARKWAHYTSLLVAVSWIFLLYSVLYRFRLVPRVLAAFGLVASMLQITGVTLRGLLGYSPETRLAMPLAPAYVALAVWLMVKGFDERHCPLQAEARGAEVAGA